MILLNIYFPGWIFLVVMWRIFVLIKGWSLTLRVDMYCIACLYRILLSVRLVLNVCTCTVVGLNRTFVEAKMFTFTLECMYFIFNKCPF
jgi:hypothetical protein